MIRIVQVYLRLLSQKCLNSQWCSSIDAKKVQKLFSI